eukprot:3291677-Rhodomonas_salina.1
MTSQAARSSSTRSTTMIILRGYCAHLNFGINAICGFLVATIPVARGKHALNTDRGIVEPLRLQGFGYTPKSNTRNRISRTNHDCTGNA